MIVASVSHIVRPLFSDGQFIITFEKQNPRPIKFVPHFPGSLCVLRNRANGFGIETGRFKTLVKSVNVSPQSQVMVFPKNTKGL